MQVARMLCQLRIKWYSLFARRIRNSSKSWQPEDEAVLSAIINILSCEDQAIGLTVMAHAKLRYYTSSSKGKNYQLHESNTKTFNYHASHAA